MARAASLAPARGAGLSPLPPPKDGHAYHIYCSAQNPGAKALMEEVIRKHLGWLIVWGNVFGGFIGLVSLLVGY